MSINVNWPRWIFASMSKHFDDSRGSLVMHLEGTHNKNIDEDNLIELRMDGPIFNEVSKSYWKVGYDVNVLIRHMMDDTNFHAIHTNAGIIAGIFTDVAVFQYGTPGDDSQFGCLHLDEPVKITHYGQIKPDIKMLQATVEGHYVGFLTS